MYNVQEEEKPIDDQELVYVNVWENIDGDVKLTGQRPISRLEFDEMQKNRDFSELMLYNSV